MKEEFYEREWKDWKKIKIMKRDKLLWLIWNERANKLIWGLVGLMTGIMIGLIK